MDVSIVIVNYKTPLLTKECVFSILEKTFNISYEIIIVDNNSQDESLEILSCFSEKVKLISSDENVGFGRANNLGAKIAQGKYLFLLNSDTLLINNAVRELYGFMENTPQAGACCGNLFNKDLTPNYSYGLVAPSIYSILIYRSQCSKLFPHINEHFNVSDQNKEVEIIIGADFFVHKQIYDEVGGFDPKYFMYVEDGDLSRSIVKLQYKLYNVPNAKIVHLQGASSSKSNTLIWEIQSYIYYFKKFKNDTYTRLYLLVELIFIVIKLIVFLIGFNRVKISQYYQTLKYVIRNFFR